MATICKDRYYEYDYYHTSLDNLNFVKPECINQSLNLYSQVIELLDKNVIYTSLKPDCEIMLSKHGLYPTDGGGMLPGENSGEELDIILWLFFYCDGAVPLQSISEKIGITLSELYEIAMLLEQKGLLQRIK
jgi:aminopeptidase-like protein